MSKTIQALTVNPMQIVRRFLLALLGGFLAMGSHLYFTFRMDDWLNPGRIGSSIAAGLIFGIVVAFMVIFASEYPARLKGIWSFPARAALALTAGIVIGTLSWFSFQYLLLLIEATEWGMLLFGGIGLAAGFILTGLFALPRPVSILITAIATYVPIYITFQNYLLTMYYDAPSSALLYYSPDKDWMVYVFGIPFALSIALFGQIYPAHRRRKEVTL
jgi:hypothetical protein